MPLENENKVVNDIRDEPVNEIVAEPIEEIVGQKSIDQDVLKKGKKELNDGEDRVDIFWLWSSSWLPSLFWFALGSGFSSTGATPNSADSERFATSTYPYKSGYQAIPDSTTNAVMHVNPQFCRLHHPWVLLIKLRLWLSGSGIQIRRQ